jgi:hypothetical protein
MSAEPRVSFKLVESAEPTKAGKKTPANNRGGRNAAASQQSRRGGGRGGRNNGNQYNHYNNQHNRMGQQMHMQMVSSAQRCPAYGAGILS